MGVGVVIQKNPDPPVTKSLAYLNLDRQHRNAMDALDEAQDAIHEAKRHLMAGDVEAAIGCLADYVN